MDLVNSIIADLRIAGEWYYSRLYCITRTFESSNAVAELVGHTSIIPGR